MKRVSKRAKRTIGYYARKVIIIERQIATEDNKIIRMIWNILLKYYTNKWERWYD